MISIEGHRNGFAASSCFHENAFNLKGPLTADDLAGEDGALGSAVSRPGQNQMTITVSVVLEVPI